MQDTNVVDIYNRICSQVLKSKQDRNIPSEIDLKCIGFDGKMEIEGAMEYYLFIKFANNANRKRYQMGEILEVNGVNQLLTNVGYVRTWKSCYHKCVKQLRDIKDCEYGTWSAMNIAKYVMDTLRKIVDTGTSFSEVPIEGLFSTI